MADKLIGNTEPDKDAPPAGDPPAGDPPAGDPPAAGARPEHIPEQFWDADAGELKTDDLITEYSNLTKPKEGIPADMAGYQVVIPEDIGLPEGYEMKIDESDPMLQFWRKISFDRGSSQEEFDEGIKFWAQKQVTDMPDMAAEVAKLGENGADRVTQVDNWLANELPDELYVQIAESPFSQKAGFIEAMETLMLGKGERKPGAGGGAPPVKKTEEELKAMMADPRYHKTKDPAFIKQVQDGFKALYPGKSRIGGFRGDGE